MKKLLLIFLLVAAFGCGSDSNNGTTTNNGTTPNNGTTTNNGTTSNNGTTPNNGVTTNNETAGTNNATGGTNNTTGGTNNGTIATPDFIDYPVTGTLVVQLEGGPYMKFNESGSTLSEFIGYDGINWTLGVDESKARFSLEDSLGAELAPGIHGIDSLFLNFTIDTALEDPALNVNLSNGFVEIEKIDTATGAIKLRLHSVLSAAETGLAEDVVLDAAFDLVVPTAL